MSRDVEQELTEMIMEMGRKAGQALPIHPDPQIRRTQRTPDNTGDAFVCVEELVRYVKVLEARQKQLPPPWADRAREKPLDPIIIRITKP